MIKQLVYLVGASPHVTYDCSGAPFGFDLFRDVVARGATIKFEDGSMVLRKTIIAPQYLLLCEWSYTIH
eukprot:SAG31_NODE_42795_length_270_cov_0.596491_2_plen_68_part_01